MIIETDIYGRMGMEGESCDIWLEIYSDLNLICAMRISFLAGLQWLFLDEELLNKKIIFFAGTFVEMIPFFMFVQKKFNYPKFSSPLCS